jgi:hypothetical protein
VKELYVIMGIHHPKSGMEKALLETLVKFGNAERGHKGLITAFAWKDDNSSVISGLTFWDTKEDYDAARPDMDNALKGVDWRTVDESIEIYRGSPVAWT